MNRKYIVYGSRNSNESEREKRNRKLARKIAADGIVLLKNNGTLPLQPDNIAIYGSGARMTVRGGTGSGDMNERKSVNLEEGLVNAGFLIGNTRGMDRFDQHYEKAYKAWRREIELNIKKYRPWQIMSMFDYIHEHGFQFPCELKIQEDEIDTDAKTAIYVIARQAGEGHDRQVIKGDYLLDDTELFNIELLTNTYKDVILVINSGGVVDLSVLDKFDGISAVLYIGQAGTEGGNAFADIISGKVTPSGKLTETWARDYSDYPNANSFSHMNGDLEQEDYVEDIYVGYRYFSSFEVEPRFAFGYGLSYTEFESKVLNVELKKERISLKVRIKNAGSTYKGQEIIQVYLELPQVSKDQEKITLSAYGKTKLLAPGENEIIELSFSLRDVTSFDEATASYKLYKGEYGILVGNSSNTLKTIAVMSLEEDIISEKMDHICPVISPFNVMKKSLTPTQYPKEVKRITISSSSIPTRQHTYQKPVVTMSKETSRAYESLSSDDLISLCVGGPMMGKKFYINTPGCVGRTTTSLLKKGIPNVNFCDGPAGLRVQKESVFSKQGVGYYMNELPADYNWGIIKKTSWFSVKKPHQGLAVYQYMTAWPAASVQAQTWDVDLLQQVGDAIGVEMKEVGCTLWLAPALNIKRNPLCGRNFEYYSEDPLISGTMATAITKGVQQHSGVGVVTKHFICNNQEDNRNLVSENVTERALRDIYLKGFRKVIEEAKPWAMMTSYNKVNDVYTANSYDLVTKVLRNEWGFEGLVMTDWNAANNEYANYEMCLTVGNDLIMPGDETARKGLRNALNNAT